MTAYALGRSAEIDPGVIQRFLNGERDIRLDTAARIALALGLRLVETARGRGRPSKPSRPVPDDTAANLLKEPVEQPQDPPEAPEPAEVTEPPASLSPVVGYRPVGLAPPPPIEPPRRAQAQHVADEAPESVAVPEDVADTAEILRPEDLPTPDGEARPAPSASSVESWRHVLAGWPERWRHRWDTVATEIFWEGGFVHPAEEAEAFARVSAEKEASDRGDDTSPGE